MIKLGAAILMSALLMSSASAQAACIFNDKHYSQGAIFCSAKHMKLKCSKDGTWESLEEKTSDPAFCDGNPSATPQ
jgi:hypothetical protein